jgi:Fe-S cluster assembly protein SufD
MKSGLSAEAREPYVAQFASTLGATKLGWLGSARQAAFDAFLAQGWPGKKQEEWRFTDLGPITESGLLPYAASASPWSPADFDADLVNLGGDEGNRMVFVDGYPCPGPEPQDASRSAPLLAAFSSQQALASGEPLTHLGRHLANRNAFIALNTAFMRDGALVHLPAGCQAEQPIYLVFLASAAGNTSFPRTLIVADAGSRATVVEIHLGADGRRTLSNAATEIVLGPNARLAYHTVLKPSQVGFHIGHVAITQAAGSTFSSHSVSLDGRIVRNDIHAVLAGESSSCELDGIYLADGGGHVDNQTTIDHCAPRSTSREEYRGVVAGSAQAVFSGRIIVRPGADKTDARQTNRNLLLSDQAQVNSKPQLEIFTSDVKCSHGATSGQLDPEALFYLRARGIDERQARLILTRAFIQQIVERAASPRLGSDLQRVLDQRIADLVHGEESR